MYRIISCVAVILWAVLIFSLSHQPVVQSSQLSVGITEVIVEQAEKVPPNVGFNIGSFHHIVGKNLHFFLYLVFSFLVINSLRRSGMHGYMMLILSLLVCVLHAI